MKASAPLFLLKTRGGISQSALFGRRRGNHDIHEGVGGPVAAPVAAEAAGHRGSPDGPTAGTLPAERERQRRGVGLEQDRVADAGHGGAPVRELEAHRGFSSEAETIPAIIRTGPAPA